MSADGKDTRATRRYYAALLAVIAAGVLTRLFHFQLALGCDDQLWLLTARGIGESHRLDIPPVFYSRILWRALLAFWGALFGSSLELSAVLMFLLSCLTVFMVAESARTVFGKGAGLLAAALYATHPLSVLWDVKTLPDGMALALLATAIFLFLKYLQQDRLGWLLAAGVLVGLSYSVKDYYILTAIPFGLGILLQDTQRKVKLRNVCLFSAAVAAGLAVDFALHYWESGNPLAHPMLVAGYGEKIAGWYPNQAAGMHRLHSLFWERLRYVPWLLVDGGIVNGFLLLWGLVYLAVKAKSRLDCRVLLMAAAMFFLFLVAMPTSLWPPAFVEMQQRYLSILLPMLAIGGGAALAETFGSLKAPAARRSLIGAAVLAFCFNAYVPNHMLDYYRVQEFVGIRKVLSGAEQAGIVELVLPARYDTFLPDCFRSYGVEFQFRDAQQQRWVESAAEYLTARAGRAVFVPERPFPKTDAYGRLKQRLAGEGFLVERVRVPRTSYRSWLYRFDLHDANDQLVGWICRPADNTSQQSSRK